MSRGATDDADAPAGSYGHLRPGRLYRVARAFTDFDGRLRGEGELHRFLEHSWFPYDDGLTLRMDGDTIRLCGLEPEQAAIMADISSYLREVPEA